MEYQNLTKFNGSMYGEPSYGGIEYDWEVPDNLTVSSPGGVSSVHHHYTKGFYGKGDSSSDIYAGQGNRYIAGEFGNLYEEGHTAGQGMGYYGDAPDYPFYNAETKVTGGTVPYGSNGDISNVNEKKTSTYTSLTQNPTSKNIKSDIEFVDEKEHFTKLGEDTLNVMYYVKKIVGFVFLVCLFVCLCFYFNTFNEFLKSKMGALVWQQYLAFSILLTALVVLLGYMSDWSTGF